VEAHEEERNSEGKMNNEPFDWVEARSKCTLAKVFQQLRAEVKTDVEKRNSMRGDQPFYEFSMASSQSDDFTVILSRNGVTHRIVTFGMVGNEIVVADQGNTELARVSLTLNNNAQCRLKTKKDEELEFWQFRRLTLEKLFFQSIPHEGF